jgi:hypothetical protein
MGHGVNMDHRRRNLRSELASAILGSVAILLTLTGLSKLGSVVAASSWSTAILLATSDPLLFVPAGVLMVLTGLLELLLAAYILIGKSQSLACRLTSMLGAQFVMYRAALLATGFVQPCPCLGTVVDWLGLSEKGVNGFLWMIAGWFIFGGVVAGWLSRTGSIVAMSRV